MWKIIFQFYFTISATNTTVKIDLKKVNERTRKQLQDCGTAYIVADCSFIAKYNQ
jgi:hypothetical protein